MEFKLIKKSKKSRARLGILNTSHGEVETPALVPVATRATVKTLTSEDILKTKSQILIANTFHLHLKPGEDVVKRAGGINAFSHIKVPFMTDSGGFQVFSLGFGRDTKVGKVLKIFPGKDGRSRMDVRGTIDQGHQPKQLKITHEGVHFRSPLDGGELFLGPRESIKIQEKIGADIMFAFDECTSPLSSREYIERSLEKTHRWAKICVETKKTKQALFGIVQGSRFKDLREKSAAFINALPFDGFGIGGDLGSSKIDMKNILDWTVPLLDEQKPRHLLGIGYLEDMERIIKSGIDLFDCTVPTHYGRRGIAFTSSGKPFDSAQGKLDLNKSKFLKDQKPVDKKCLCEVCLNYRRSYIAHLVRSGEITGMRLLTLHNLFFFNSFVEGIRKKIKEGKL